MKSLSVFIIILFLLVVSSRNTYSQESSDNLQNPFTFEALYTGDYVNNLFGGIKRGSCYLGLASLRMSFDTEKAKFWKGGILFINASNTHGCMPSYEYIGDMQIVSNIEAGNHSYIQEFFYRQMLQKTELTLGLQDLNIEFANSEHASLFLNSSFGILPLISGNISAPIFPLTTVGFTAKWEISKTSSWLIAVYDGCPSEFESNPYNLHWEFKKGDGILIISEYQISSMIHDLPGTYKIGFYSHNHLIEESFGKIVPDTLQNNAFGFYGYADQKLWSQSKKSIGLFIQTGYSPSKEVINNFYLGMGLNYSGLFSRKGKDILGLAFGCEHFTNHLKSETVLELSYQYQLNTNIYFQPDVQYVINPAGTGENISNAMVAILRFGINF